MEWLNSSVQIGLPMWVIALALPGLIRIAVDGLSTSPLKKKVAELEADRDYWKRSAITFHDNAMKLSDKVYREQVSQTGVRFVNFVLAPEGDEDA